jgi:phosphatidylserine decarboxylase
VYNEKLLFPVQKHERLFSVNFSVVDHDKISFNDSVASVDWNIQELLATKPVSNDKGLYNIATGSDDADSLAFKKFGDAVQYVLPLSLQDADKYPNNKPTITFKAKFLPYSALRQHFWRGLIRNFDIDDTKSLSYIELSTMLESLGSTLSEDTKNKFFTSFGKTLDDELTEDEVVICLERQIVRDSAFQPLDEANPTLDDDGQDTKDIFLQESGLSSALAAETELRDDSQAHQAGNQSGSSDESSSDEIERVIQIATCPVCNQPRLRKRTEVDIVTHIATCASTNWAKMDALVLQRYVTRSQASKRWYIKIASKLSYGNYQLGANSANILVQDRITGVVQEEKMSIYVRMGMRLLYQGLKSSRMEAKRIRGLLRSLSVKQGRKYDSPASVQSIVPFIKFHNLNMQDVLEPVENFKSFNEFFYRKLKKDARVLEAKGNPKIAVSPADCRASFFPTVEKATEIWIKGKSFSISRLFGTAYPDLAPKYEKGSLAIFRLAPQDYHRFHVPVKGTLGAAKKIEGEYYTVNPMAVRSTLDVYGENVRVLVPIDSQEFGKVMVVCVGAMMVGSTVITAETNAPVDRMDELGYFQFGGSTLVVLFEPGRIVFDEDLVANSAEAVETLIRVGMSIGHVPGEPEYDREDIVVGKEDEERARREIMGAGDKKEPLLDGLDSSIRSLVL